MMGSSSEPKGRLTPIQRELLAAFFERAQGFFLTGGAVLVEYHLRHRVTDDLDLFCVDDEAYEDGIRALDAAARAIGAEAEALRTSQDFRRFLFRRRQEAVVVDLVRDRAPQLHDKEVIGAIIVDTADEIAANKICSIAGRSEIRDLVDLMYLDRAGHRIEDRLEDAIRKDGGVTPATLAWVLSQISVGDEAQLPGETSPAELRRFLAELQRRLRRLAFPPE